MSNLENANLKKAISYIRVSTKKHGQSGLGLEAQQAAVADYIARNKANLISEYREVETGKISKRPELQKALAHARRSGATLVVAKLDRLARNVAFTSALMESGAEFVACDNEHANKLTIHILAAVAEDEAERIAARTKAALAAYKARGGVLGTPENLTQNAREKGARAAGEAHRDRTRLAYADLVGPMQAERDGGATLQAIADGLNGQGQTTQRGLPWTPTAVHRVLARA